jgi:DnaJ-class molecular chaperone
MKSFTQYIAESDYNKVKENCPKCGGSGEDEGRGAREDFEPCADCDGTGKITVATKKTPRTPSGKVAQ